MTKKPKNLFKLLFGHKDIYLTAEDVKPARSYIAGYWKNLERFHPKDDETLLGLPRPYLVPAYEEGHSFDFNEMYYWDSYFMAQGLLDKKHKNLVMGMLENLLYMQKRFAVIPNASRTYLMGRSQPPLLTTFIFDVYKAYNLDLKWLKQSIGQAKDEYKTVWMGSKKPNERQVYSGLSRYYDINHINDLAEAESGWDMTTRFDRKALDYLPIDLNCLLYKYETDFALTAKLLGDYAEMKQWQKKANIRKNTVDSLMWNEMKGFYYDYNYKKEKRGSIASLAGLFPLWVGMVDDRRAIKLVKALQKFEEKGGLATTERQAIPSNPITSSSPPTQWAHPNGWAPLQLIVIQGLERYGFHEDARRIANKWLKNNLDWFNKNNVFLEKYNVVDPNKPPAKGLYPSQTGFGWTNAVFEKLSQDYIDER